MEEEILEEKKEGGEDACFDGKEEASSSDEEISSVLEEEASQGYIKKLREKLKICESERMEYLSGWQRAKADYINAKKSEEKNLAELEPFLTQKILLEIIPIADNFDMAFANKGSLDNLDKNWRAGIEAIYSNLISIFSGLGLLQFGKEGDAFDPEKYQAVESIQVSDEKEDGRVASVLQKGYSLRGRTIRPCRVRVKVLNKK